MDEVKTLSYKFFVGAANVGGKSNEYTGSVSLNPSRHNAYDSEFKYKMFLTKNEDGEFSVNAQCYVGRNSFSNTDPEKIQTLCFEGSDKGVEQAREWLQQAYEKVRDTFDKN